MGTTNRRLAHLQACTDVDPLIIPEGKKLTQFRITEHNSHMSNNDEISIFRTNKIPTTHISQNHLDALNTAIENFLKTHKEYNWCYIADNNRRIESGKLIAHINKNKPRTIHYLISSSSGRELIINIENGITVNLKNGSHELYGLYTYVNDTIDTVKVPHTIAFLRRYWLFNSVVAAWLIPILLFLIFKNTAGAIVWLIVFPIGLLMLMANTISDEFVSRLEWEDIVLSTKIQYGNYHPETGSPLISLISSSKTMVSVAASLATVLSFILFIAQR